MRVVILENANDVSRRAADLICGAVRAKPNAVLGLATGSTPLGTYQELVLRARSGEIQFDQVTTFNLDEYVGLPADHPQSYRSFMRMHLFQPASFSMERCHLPQCNTADIQSACESYEQKIRDAGGIDMQLLGLGSDGHIAFNEPGSSLASRTRVKALTEQTRADNARFFDSAEGVPQLAVTVGIGTILDARQAVLLATGDGKAAAVRSFVEGPVTSQVPASALQLHRNALVLLDEAAASWLVRKDYYRHVETIQSSLENGTFGA